MMKNTPTFQKPSKLDQGSHDASYRAQAIQTARIDCARDNGGGAFPKEGLEWFGCDLL
jgi:hypothetical protein